MFRERQRGAFSVRTAPSAWRDLGRIERSAHQRIIDALSGIAEIVSLEPATLADVKLAARLFTIVDGYRVEYEIAPETRTVDLLAVLPAESAP